ncbi:hypothetical protein NDU88_004690 [Pleurodeles waltl]|uniref:Uncharacterized protein n=1 Tax=Pleurodeles waltl TaxID=8319 RepID=A0AAV7SJI1_PLEWA|nr:hypothetical protein NDU88_004690 [Pleurodeles waltl]
MNPTLAEPHHRQLTHLIEKTRDIISKRPGRTNHVHHLIQLKIDKVSRQRPYQTSPTSQCLLFEFALCGARENVARVLADEQHVLLDEAGPPCWTNTLEPLQNSASMDFIMMRFPLKQ